MLSDKVAFACFALASRRRDMTETLSDAHVINERVPGTLDQFKRWAALREQDAYLAVGKKC